MRNQKMKKIIQKYNLRKNNWNNFRNNLNFVNENKNK